MAVEFAKSRDGLVHLVNAINAEFTVCGNAFEGDCIGDGDLHAWKPTKATKVTCEICQRAIDDIAEYLKRSKRKATP